MSVNTYFSEKSMKTWEYFHGKFETTNQRDEDSWLARSHLWVQFVWYPGDPYDGNENRHVTGSCHPLHKQFRNQGFNQCCSWGQKHSQCTASPTHGRSPAIARVSCSEPLRHNHIYCPLSWWGWHCESIHWPVTHWSSNSMIFYANCNQMWNLPIFKNTKPLQKSLLGLLLELNLWQVPQDHPAIPWHLKVPKVLVFQGSQGAYVSRCRRSGTALPHALEPTSWRCPWKYAQCAA